MLLEISKPADGEAQRAFTAVGEILAGRWKTLVLWFLLEGSHRYGELAARMQTVTPKVLTQQLRELERQGLIRRLCANHGPRHVEYFLTPLGKSLRPVLIELRAWSARHHDGADRQVAIEPTTDACATRDGVSASTGHPEFGWSPRDADPPIHRDRA
jgi:DNA-binding HxlR family transcriptional regulator